MVKCLRAREKRKKNSSSSSHGCKLFHLFSGKTVKGRLSSERARREGDNVFTFTTDVPFILSPPFFLQLQFRRIKFTSQRNVRPLASGKIYPDECITQSLFNMK